MKRKRRTSTIACLCILSLGLVGFVIHSCKKKSQTTLSDSTALVIGVMPSVDYLPIAVAEQKGFFSQPIKLVHFASPMERDAALQTGAVDASVTDYMGAMLLHSKGTDVLLPIACQGMFRLVLGRSTPLAKISDLRGHHVGLSSNTLIEYATEKTLVEGNHPFPYTRVEVQAIPIRLEMLRSGDLDGAILPEPFASIGVAKGLSAIDLPKGLTSNITGLLFLSKATKKEAALRSFLMGYDKAVDYISTHPRKEWIGVLQGLLGISPEVASTIPLPSYTKATLPRSEDLQPILTWMRGKGLVPTDYNAEGLIRPLIQDN